MVLLVYKSACRKVVPRVKLPSRRNFKPQRLAEAFPKSSSAQDTCILSFEPALPQHDQSNNAPPTNAPNNTYVIFIYSLLSFDILFRENAFCLLKRFSMYYCPTLFIWLLNHIDNISIFLRRHITNPR